MIWICITCVCIKYAYTCAHICRYINICIKYVYNILLIVNASWVSENNIYRNVCDRSVVNLNWGLINSHYLHLPDKWNGLQSSYWKFSQIPAVSRILCAFIIYSRKWSLINLGALLVKGWIHKHSFRERERTERWNIAPITNSSLNFWLM